MNQYLRMIIGESQFVCSVKQIQTVLPLSRLDRSLSLNGAAGAVSFRQQLIPVIDVRQSLTDVKSKLYLNTRIILIDHDLTCSRISAYLIEKAIDLIAVERSEDIHRSMNSLVYQGNVYQFLPFNALNKIKCEGDYVK